MSEKAYALGVELDDPETSPAYVSGVLVIAEGLNEDGSMCHAVMGSNNMSHVTAAGLLRFAQQWVDIGLRQDVMSAFFTEEE